MKDIASSMLDFCIIQTQVLKDREQDLRKQILNCKLQREYLESMIHDIGTAPNKEKELIMVKE